MAESKDGANVGVWGDKNIKEVPEELENQSNIDYFCVVLLSFDTQDCICQSLEFCVSLQQYLPAKFRYSVDTGLGFRTWAFYQLSTEKQGSQKMCRSSD